jgi:hypothetical protein
MDINVYHMEELVLFNRRLKLINGEVYSFVPCKNPYWRKIKPSVEKKDGYLVFGLGFNNKRRQFKYHRVIYKFHNRDWDILDDRWENQIDHINLIKNDNVIENLRVVNQSQNQQNRDDVKGYYYNKNSKKWKAYITLNNKTHHLGYFKTEAEAIEARTIAEQNLYTHTH